MLFDLIKLIEFLWVGPDFLTFGVLFCRGVAPLIQVWSGWLGRLLNQSDPPNAEKYPAGFKCNQCQQKTSFIIFKNGNF